MANFSYPILKIGTVLRFYVTDTIPPKVKRLIIVGIDNELVTTSTIFINSEINPNVFTSEELKRLQYKLEANKCAFLDHDSYADCSDVRERKCQDILNLFSKSPQVNLGQLESNDLIQIRLLIKSAKTISVRIKKKFGFFTI